MKFFPPTAAKSVAAITYSLFFAVSAAQAAPALLDKVAVIVDDDIIMESELQNRLFAVKGNLARQEIDAPEDDELRHQVLERMIVENLQLQMGERAGVRISDSALNDAMANIAGQNGMGLEQFRQALVADGSSYVEMRENVRQEMILKRVQQGNVNSRVQITEQEVESFLESEEGRQLTAPAYRVEHFMLVAGSANSEADKLSRKSAAEALVAELRAGKAFAPVLAAKSYKGIGSQGGDLGWRKQDDLPSIFASVVPSLEPGQYADPIEADSGVHIIKLAEQRGGEKRSVEQTQVRHILIKVSEIMTAEQAQEKARGLRQQIIDGVADFAALAKEHSEDIGSASEGGSLGWTTPGQMVPEFEQVMLSATEGEISEPFASNFGWHILQVEGRRQQDVSDQLIKNRASQFIYQRKFDDELEAWLQKIRDEAYVDIK